MQTLMFALQGMLTQRRMVGINFQQLQHFGVSFLKLQMPFQKPDFLAFVVFGEH